MQVYIVRCKIRDDIEKLMDREENVCLNNCGVKKIEQETDMRSY